MLDSTAVAEHVGTDTKTLRRFLRSRASSVQPVGSAGRYTFTPSQLATIKAEYDVWNTNHTTPAAAPVAPQTRKRASVDRDHDVWAEEGDFVLPDIRDPRIRREVRRDAAMAEARLEAMLLAAGLHVTQMRDRVHSR